MAAASADIIGSPLPNLTLRDQEGVTRRLTEFIGAPLVIYFYPADGTPICTAQACSFRDSLEAFNQLGARVIGISADAPETHAAFARRWKLSFPLLSDPDNAARAAFKVPSTLGLFPGRTTYIVDRRGTIREMFSNPLMASWHVKRAKEALARLA